jgi:hypothetical protein
MRHTFLFFSLILSFSVGAQIPESTPMAFSGYGNTVYVWGARIDANAAAELATLVGADKARMHFEKVAPSRLVSPTLGLASGLSFGLAFLNVDRQNEELNTLGMVAYVSAIGTGLATLLTMGLPERHMRIGVKSFNDHYSNQSFDSSLKVKADSTMSSFLGLVTPSAPSQHRFHRLVSGLVVLDGQTMSTLRASQMCRWHGMDAAANYLQEASELELRYNYFQNSQLGTLLEIGQSLQHRRLIDAAKLAIKEYNRGLSSTIGP